MQKVYGQSGQQTLSDDNNKHGPSGQVKK